MANTLAEMPLEEQVKHFQEGFESAMRSVAHLQAELDKALQKHHDDAAAHNAEIEKLEAAHAATLDAALAEQATKITSAHHQEIAKLKKQFLAPAMEDLHRRQMADLAAKHQVEIEALKS